ncbi:MAG: EscU/YscU/HrcU family type III secretion system export apparatus switch protein [Burkholderiaceae bacterium]|jgi:type III secretion protein U
MSGEKTEEPTDHKLKDARKKGQVAVSKDVMLVIQLLMFFSAFFVLIEHVAEWIVDYSQSLMPSSGKINEITLLRGFIEGRDLTIKIVSLGFVTTILGGWIGVFSQIGFLFAPEAVKPSFKKFNVVGNIKNMFSMKSISQILISLIKVACFAIIFYYIFNNRLSNIIFSYQTGLKGILYTLLSLLKVLVFSALILFIVLSAIDWSITFFFHRKSLRMSKKEIFDEYKQMEGDPHFKSHRKQTHRSLMNSSLSQTSKAKVVVANPTHIAVALDYEPGVHDLPYILAIETDEFAYLVRKQAYEMGIPVIRNIKLAQGLYHDAQVNQYIPSQHIKMAAEIFKEVMRIAKQAAEAAEAAEKEQAEQAITPAGSEPPAAS